MFANKRINKENGFVNIPKISIGINTIFIGTGTHGIQKMCFQESAFPLKLTYKKVKIAKQTVTEIFQVTFKPSGVKPNKFNKKIKKKAESKFGIYFLYFLS